MKFWDRIKTAAMIVMTSEKRVQRKIADAMTQDLIDERLESAFWTGGKAPESEIAPVLMNPFLAQDESEAVYETLEDSMYALWPLLNATEYGGVLAARGLVWGALYTFTMDETPEDVKGISFELARLVREYMPEDQDPDQMPGVLVGDGATMEQAIKEQAENPYTARPEIAAFMDGALGLRFDGAANVTHAVSNRLGRQAWVDQPGNYEDEATAIKLMAVNFMGSILASMASRFGDLVTGDSDGE